MQPRRRTGDGELFEEAVQVTDAEGHTWIWRCVVLRLKQPTHDGHRDLILLTNLPAEQADAATVAELHRGRWTIETAFQTLEGAPQLQTQRPGLSAGRAVRFLPGVGRVLSLCRGHGRAARGVSRSQGR
ncbi:MAG: transposase [Chromatiaceae bacterium]|nr:transposase [Chromatiaceae bacterium]MCF8002705.1 transposase [Chromatiaceae bacterium]